MILRFRARGIAEPQGSARAVPVGKRGQPKRIVITHDNPDLRRWRDAVGVEAKIAMRQARFPFLGDAPCAVKIEFVLPRTTSLPKKRAAPRHTTRPDVDKLARAILDALAGVVFADDARVWRLEAVKRYADPGESACAAVEVDGSPVDEGWV